MNPIHTITEMAVKSMITFYAFVVCLHKAVVGHEVECFDEEKLTKLRQKNPDLNGIDMSCTGERWCEKVPETSPEYRAHKPESARVSYYLYHDRRSPITERATTDSVTSNVIAASPRRRVPRLRNTRIGLLIEWSNKVTQMSDIAGYMIGIHIVRQTFGYNICLNVNSTNQRFRGDKVKFVYNYLCEDDYCAQIKPDTRLIISIISFPGNHDVTEATAAFEVLQVPKCPYRRNRRLRECLERGRHCRRSRRPNETTTTEIPATTEIPHNFTTTSFSSSKASSSGIGLTTFSIILGVIAFSIAFIGWITWGLNAKIGMKKRILFLEKMSEELDNPCSYAFQNLIYEIKKHDLAEVTYNRWETVKLIPDPIMWITNATASADIIIALASPQDNTDENIHSLYFNEWVNSLIRNRNNETIDKKIVLVSFHLKKRDSWPEFCSGANVTKYKLPEELKKMYDAIFTTGPPKCPLSTEEMETLANEATMRPKSKARTATKVGRSLLKYADEENSMCLA